MKLLPAQMLASKIAQELEPFCERITIAGSIRRERESVNDIDLVLIAKNLGAKREILARCSRNLTLVQGDAGAQNIRFLWPTKFQLDLWFARGEEADLITRKPTNWGAVLLCRTGSIVHNTQLCAIAIKHGLKFAPYRGVVKGEEIVASETEESIYQALGLEYRDPATNRESLV